MFGLLFECLGIPENDSAIQKARQWIHLLSLRFKELEHKNMAFFYLKKSERERVIWKQIVDVMFHKD